MEGENGVPARIDYELMAYHEAGHAVVGTVLGREVEEIMFLTPDGLPAGCHFKPRHPDPYDYSPFNCPPEVSAALLDDAVIFVSGCLSEQRGTGRSYPPGHEQDAVSITVILQRLILLGTAQWGTFNEFWYAVQPRAIMLLRKHWPAVAAVAAELLQHQHLEGVRVREIIAEADETNPAPASP